MLSELRGFVSSLPSSLSSFRHALFSSPPLAFLTQTGSYFPNASSWLPPEALSAGPAWWWLRAGRAGRGLLPWPMAASAIFSLFSVVLLPTSELFWHHTQGVRWVGRHPGGAPGHVVRGHVHVSVRMQTRAHAQPGASVPACPRLFRACSRLPAVVLRLLSHSPARQARLPVFLQDRGHEEEVDGAV